MPATVRSLIGRDLDAVGGQRLARAVSCEELDVERQQSAREVGDAVAIGDREQGSHVYLRSLSVGGARRPRPAVRAHGRAEYSDRYPSRAVKLGLLLELLCSQAIPFNGHNFPDIYCADLARAIICLVVTVVLYNVQVRRLHRFDRCAQLQEWLLWTASVVFGLLLVEARLPLLLPVRPGRPSSSGCATFVWIRFFRFPPMIRRTTSSCAGRASSASRVQGGRGDHPRRAHGHSAGADRRLPRRR